jgi:iron complex outermembrane receptor protein
MKTLYTIILFIFISAISFSEANPIKVSLTGKVTDKTTGETIIGATIYIPDLKTGTITDTAGNYRIDNLPATNVGIEISYVGYKTIIENINLSSSTTIDFKLEESVAELNEVVVTGSSKAVEIRRNPVPIIALNHKEIEQVPSTNIIDAIATMPGISAVTTGPNVSKPFIHGLGYNRVLTLYDGVRQEGQQWGDEHGIEVDDDDVNRIEVIKGPASLIYGSDAIAGVVNLLPAPTVPNGTIKGSVLGNFQANNGLFGGSIGLAGNSNGLVWNGRLSHKEAKDYQNKNDGRVFGTAYNETDFSGMLGLNKSWGYSHINFSIFDDLQEIPDGSRYSATNHKFTKQVTEADSTRPIVANSELNSYKIEPLHQHVQHYRIYSSNNFILGNAGKIGLILGFQQNVRREFSHPLAPEVAGLYLVLNSYTYDLKYYLPEWNKWETTIGVNGMYQTNLNKGTEFIIPDYKQFDFGPFALVKKNFNKLDVSAGLRYDTRSFNNDAMNVGTNPNTGFDMQLNSTDTTGVPQRFSKYSKVFSGVTGSVGLTYNFNENFSIKANVARGFRAPNISEISANGVHPGTDMYQIGDVNKPEFSLQEDLGFFVNFEHVNGYIDLFNNNISNYIFNQKLLNSNGQDSIITGVPVYKFLQSNADLYGGEANLDIHPHPLDWLHFENAISLVYAANKGGNGVQITDSSKYLPFIPPIHIHSELRADIKEKLGSFSSIYFKVEMDHYATQNRVYLQDNTETVTPGYTLFGAGIGADVLGKNGKKLFNIQVLASNITNVAYQSNMSRLKYMDFYINKSGNPANLTGPGTGIYNMGRNISFKISVPLDL